MRHFASPEFWACYRALPKDVQELADEKYKLLKANARHPSLQLKKSDASGRPVLVYTTAFSAWTLKV